MKITEKDLLKAGVHFGHKPSSWHPRMSDFIFTQKNNIHIIDLTKTKEKLEQALEFVKKITTENKQILFVGTKIQAKEIIEKYAQECEMPFVNQKWLGGTLTNFKVINGLVRKLEKLEAQAKQEDYEQKYKKKERHIFDVEMRRLTKMIKGIRLMKQIPGAIFIASAREQKTAIREANNKNVPIIAICDTNTNPLKVTYPIPANDDAVRSIELITKLISDEIKKNKNKIKEEK